MFIKSTALIVIIWGLFSAFNVYANDVENFSWSLLHQGDYQAGGYLSETFSMYGSDILNSQSSELSGLGIGTGLYFRHDYRALHRNSGLTVTVNPGAALNPDISNSLWLFSQGVGQPPESVFRFNIRTTSLLRGPRITDRQYRFWLLAAVFCCPCTAWLIGMSGYSLCEGVEERQDRLRLSYLGNLHPGVEIYHQSLAAGGGDLLNEPGIPIPVNTSVIHLSSRDETTLQWLRRTVRNTSSREDVIIIPGFIHEPTRVRVEVIPPDTARGDVFYTVNLWSPENPAFQRIRMNVVPVSDIHHSISALFIYIGEAELRVSVYNPESALPDYAPPNEAPPAYSQTNRPYTSDQDLQAGELPAPFARGGFEHAFQPSGSGGH